MQIQKATAITVLALLVSLTAYADEGAKKKYVRGAFALGFPSSDVGDWGTQYGLSTALGYQYDEIWAADVEFTWTGGGDFNGISSDTSAWAILLNARMYLLPLLGEKGTGPIRPYVITGFGAANANVDSLNVDATAFAINLGAGADVMLGKRWGLYGEVAHKFHTETKLVNGVTNLNFGALFMF